MAPTRLMRIAASIGLAILGLTSAAEADPPPSGWVLVETKQSFDALNARLDAAIAANGMNLVNQASASEGAKAQGILIPGNRVVGVFRNDFARRMLAANLLAGIEAPIRFYVWETPAHTATLAWRKPSTVFGPYVAGVTDDLGALGKELDGVFAKIARDATGQ